MLGLSNANGVCINVFIYIIQYKTVRVTMKNRISNITVQRNTIKFEGKESWIGIGEKMLYIAFKAGRIYFNYTDLVNHDFIKDFKINDSRRAIYFNYDGIWEDYYKDGRSKTVLLKFKIYFKTDYDFKKIRKRIK